MSILITGGSGFLGTALTERLLKKGHRVYSLSRHPPAPTDNLIPIEGDILLPDLGLEEVPEDIWAIHHLAAIHKLGEDRDGSIWESNVQGTKNVIAFCTKHDISHLYFTSTAYTQGRNSYERSKALCETMLRESGIPFVTIFKPPIIMGTPQHFYPGHFSQFVTLLVQVHQRAEIVRRKFEGTLRLPVIEPVFRMKANSKGKLNLIQIDQVADAMARIDSAGTYWLTHPDPPSIEQLVDWIGEFIMVRIAITPDFKPSPVEIMFQKMSAAFVPYLWGDNFPSDLKEVPPITREFIQQTIKSTILT